MSAILDEIRAAGPSPEMREKIMALREEGLTKMKAILSEDQLKKFEAAMQQLLDERLLRTDIAFRVDDDFTHQFSPVRRRVGPGVAPCCPTAAP